jgi:hypothetical protein
MNSNNPSEQRAYQRRLKRLRARDRRWGDLRSRRLQEINEAYDDHPQERERWERHELRQERHALDGDLRPAPGRRNREIDDGGLD